ncbi:MAG TPA: aminotransferase class I/II-fold pyridoxal phosphate-dependent enzyme [Pseudonocardia sp.]
MADSDDLAVAPLAELRKRRSAKWRTYDASIIPLTVAEMDFDLAEPVAEILHAAVAAGDTGYAMPAPALGDAFAGFAGDRWGWEVDARQVTAMTDVGVGVVEVLRACIRSGDTVVISPPVYPPFFDWLIEVGTHQREVPLARDGSGTWRLDLPALEQAFASGPAAYVLCNPQNPVGRVHERDELAELVRLAARHDVIIVSDEIHGPLVLPGRDFTPILTVPGAADHAVALVSASKAFNLAGLKCAGIVTGADRMADVVAKLPADGRWRTGHLGVLATVAAFQHGGPWLDRLLATLLHNRDHLDALLRSELPAIRWTPPQATYLAWLDCTSVGYAESAHQHFLDDAKVALEPGVRFGRAFDGFVRLNFATSPDILDEAVVRMARSLVAEV